MWKTIRKHKKIDSDLSMFWVAVSLFLSFLPPILLLYIVLVTVIHGKGNLGWELKLNWVK